MRTVERSLDVLEVVQNHKEGIGLFELSQKTGLNESTVRRFCSTLVKRKYLYQKSKRGDYFLGFKFLTFNQVSNFAFIIKELARPFINKLCDDIQESVVLTIMDGGKPYRLDNIMPRQVVQAAAPLGGEYPLFSTSSGKIHLAYMDEKIIDTTIGLQELKAHTEHTITDKQKLRQELADIRRDGIAFDDEEYITGVKSAAAPIRAENGAVVAAVSFVGLSIRVSSVKMKQLGPAVKKCADEISQALGYRSGV